MLKLTFDDSTKMRMKAIAKSKLVLKCPKHIRYNPAHGRGCIVGRCQGCEAALEGYEAMMNLRAALVNYSMMTEKFETAKPRTRKAKVTSVSVGVSEQTQGWIDVIKNIGKE